MPGGFDVYSKQHRALLAVSLNLKLSGTHEKLSLVKTVDPVQNDLQNCCSEVMASQRSGVSNLWL